MNGASRAEGRVTGGRAPACRGPAAQGREAAHSRAMIPRATGAPLTTGKGSSPPPCLSLCEESGAGLRRKPKGLWARPSARGSPHSPGPLPRLLLWLEADGPPLWAWVPLVVEMDEWFRGKLARDYPSLLPSCWALTMVDSEDLWPTFPVGSDAPAATKTPFAVHPAARHTPPWWIRSWGAPEVSGTPEDKLLVRWRNGGWALGSP